MGEEKRASTILLVQGEAQYFCLWYNHIKEVLSSTTYKGDGIFFVYGSFDAPVRPEECVVEDVAGLEGVQDISLQNTAWTDGRNLLAKAAYCQELRRDLPYSYWLFSDDDIVFGSGESGQEMPLNSSSHHMVFFLNFLDHEATQVQAPIVMPGYRTFVPEIGDGFCSCQDPFCVSGFNDAMFNAYSRKAVPWFLPYATIPADQSVWYSQCVIFGIMESCSLEAPIVSPNATMLWVKNDMHREYVRGALNLTNLNKIILNSYGNLIPPITNDAFQQCRNLGGFSTLPDAIDHFKNQSNSCPGLTDRFDAWADLTALECKLQY